MSALYDVTECLNFETLKFLSNYNPVCSFMVIAYQQHSQKRYTCHFPIEKWPPVGLSHFLENLTKKPPVTTTLRANNFWSSNTRLFKLHTRWHQLLVLTCVKFGTPGYPSSQLPCGSKWVPDPENRLISHGHNFWCSSDIKLRFHTHIHQLFRVPW